MSSKINIDCHYEEEDYMENQTIQISITEASEDSSFYQAPAQPSKKKTSEPAIPGIPKSSFSFVNQSLTDSFGDLSGSFSDLMISQADSSAEVQPIQVGPAKQTNSQPPISNYSPVNAFSKPISNKPALPEQVDAEQQSEKYSQEYSLESYNIYQKSFYMQPCEPQGIQSQPLKPITKVERSEVSVIFRVTNYFFQVDQISVLVNGESLKYLYDEFFNKQIFVPMFNYERYDSWATNSDKDKFSLDFQPHKNFNVYLERYVAYLNDRYPREFLSILKTLVEIQQKKSAKKVQSKSFLSFGWIIDYVRDFMVVHKTETLRKTLLAKINSMKVALVYCLNANSFKYEMEQIKVSIQRAWRDLGNIQLLLSFEATEQFCSKKIQSSPQAKFKEIWNKYREDIRLNKTKFIKENLEEFII